MPLTAKSNGTTSSNVISASWFNDFFNLLTGVMADQEVTILNDLVLKAIGAAPATAPTATAVTGTALGIGAYSYVVAYTNTQGDGTSLIGPAGSVTTTSGTQNVNLSSIPTGPTGTGFRTLYRTKANAAGTYYFLVNIADNVTTTYSDTTPDASLSAIQPVLHPAFGGALFIKNASGNANATIYSDGWASFAGLLNPTTTGAASFDSGKITTDGNGNMTFVNAPTAPSYSFGNSGGGILAGVSATGSVTANLPTNGAAVFGVQKALIGGGTTKLFEVRNNGNVIALGAYQVASTTSTIATSQSFDTFDFAECYLCDKDYPGGTVVCPGGGHLLTKCTHDSCPAALVVSPKPGFVIGLVDHEIGALPMAVAGRVKVECSQPVKLRDLVVSDGSGSVRPLAPGEWGFVLGVALDDWLDDEVGILIRPMYAKG